MSCLFFRQAPDTGDTLFCQGLRACAVIARSRMGYGENERIGSVFAAFFQKGFRQIDAVFQPRGAGVIPPPVALFPVIDPTDCDIISPVTCIGPELSAGGINGTAGGPDAFVLDQGHLVAVRGRKAQVRIMGEFSNDIASGHTFTIRTQARLITCVNRHDRALLCDGCRVVLVRLLRHTREETFGGRKNSRCVGVGVQAARVNIDVIFDGNAVDFFASTLRPCFSPSIQTGWNDPVIRPDQTLIAIVSHLAVIVKSENQ